MWCQEPVELVSNKTMLVVGFGDIGAACGKLVKAFGTKVIGFKRRPDLTSKEHRLCADEILGMNELEKHLATADFVVNVLPTTEETLYFFNRKTFGQMKKSSIFMNIGRGQTVNEQELVSALIEEQIAGAVLDVFEVEPLSKESLLWSLPNVLITPHCAN